MQRYRILHRTYYNFTAPVTLGPHSLRLRPREDHELRIESLSLKIAPQADVLWHRDVESNSVAIASFTQPVRQLSIESEVIIQQYLENPLDFMVADYAVAYPFSYQSDDLVLLLPYMKEAGGRAAPDLKDWIGGVWRQGEPIQTYGLLQRLTTVMRDRITERKTAARAHKAANPNQSYDRPKPRGDAKGDGKPRGDRKPRAPSSSR